MINEYSRSTNVNGHTLTVFMNTDKTLSNKYDENANRMHGPSYIYTYYCREVYKTVHEMRTRTLPSSSMHDQEVYKVPPRNEDTTFNLSGRSPK